MTYFELIQGLLQFMLDQGKQHRFCGEEKYIEYTMNYLIESKYYFSLYEKSKTIGLTKQEQEIFNKIEMNLTTYDIDYEASYQKTYQKRLDQAMENLKNDEELSEILEQVEDDVLPDSEISFYKYYLAMNLLKNYWECHIEAEIVKKIKRSAVENIINSIIRALPAMFFLKEGNEYINNPFWIENEKLREDALYLSVTLLEGKTSTSIYYDVNAYSILYSTVKLMKLIYDLASQDRLNYLMQMEKYAEKDYPIVGKNTTLLSLVVGQTKIKNINFQDNIIDDKNQAQIDFFFSDSSLTNDLTPEENAFLIISCFYGINNENVLEKIIDNWNEIHRILKSEDSREYKERKIKKLVK